MAKDILPFDCKDLHLTIKEQKAIACYGYNGYDGPAALIEAGIASSDSPVVSVRLASATFFKRPEVSMAVQRLEQSIISPYRDRLTQQIVQQRMMRATYDPSWFYYPDGEAVPLDKIPTDRRWCIDDVQETYFGKDADRRVVHYVLADKDRAQKELMEMLKSGGDKSGKELSEKRKQLEDIFKSGKALGAGMITEIDKLLTAKVKEANKQLLDDRNKARRIDRGEHAQEVTAVVIPSDKS